MTLATIKTERVIKKFPAAILLGAVASIFAIISGMLLITPGLTLTAFFILSVIYLAISLTLRKAVQQHGKVITEQSTKYVFTIKEALGAFKEITIFQAKDKFLNDFRKSYGVTTNSQVKVILYSSIPKYLVEATLLVLMALLLLSLPHTQGGGLAFLPTLGAFVFGFFRLLPLIQNIYASTTTIYSAQPILNEIISKL